MAFNMMVWANQDGNLVSLPKQRLDREDRLEAWIEKDLSLLGLDLLIIGRQVTTPSGGRIDLLGIDAQGDVAILELKRDRTPREVVAQILDYASWIDSLSASDIISIAQNYLEVKLSDRFSERFGSALPDTINTNHRMVIVASELDESSERIVQYLSSRHSLDINVIFFNCFLFNDQELIARSWLMDPEQVEERSESRHRLPWSGYYFVNLGEGPHRNWDDCRKYNFISAGDGPRYSDPLKKLKAGDQIFAYMKGHGYVGYGEVASEAQLGRDFIVGREKKMLFELPLMQEGLKHDADDPEKAEWIVGVTWKKAFPRTEACYFKGLFANQNIVCKLRDQKTIEFVKEKFDVKDDA